MAYLIALAIIGFMALALGVAYFLFAAKLTVSLTDKLLSRHPAKGPESFFLVPSLIAMVTGFILIAANAELLILLNEERGLTDDFLLYLFMGAVMGLVMGLCHSSSLKKRLEETYKTPIYSSNHLALIGGDAVFFVGVLISFAIGIYATIRCVSQLA